MKLQLSVTRGVLKFRIAPHCPGSLLVVVSPGQIITGAIVSATVIVKEHELALPAKSVTVNVCVVVPIGKKAPLAKPAV